MTTRHNSACLMGERDWRAKGDVHHNELDRPWRTCFTRLKCYQKRISAGAGKTYVNEMSDFPEEGRLAGIDYGTVRIGVAVSDPDRTMASPYENYTRRNLESDADYFRRLVAEENIAGFVVGLPLHASGQESQKSQQVREFTAWLAGVTGRPVRFHDERYTTREATFLLGEAGMSKKRRKRRLDMLAAQLVLTAYLESGQQNAAPSSLDD